VTCDLVACCSKLHDIDVRDCAMIGPKAVDTVTMLLLQNFKPLTLQL